MLRVFCNDLVIKNEKMLKGFSYLFLFKNDNENFIRAANFWWKNNQKLFCRIFYRDFRKKNRGKY